MSQISNQMLNNQMFVNNGYYDNNYLMMNMNNYGQQNNQGITSISRPHVQTSSAKKVIVI
jgi:hypothetical protein